MTSLSLRWRLTLWYSFVLSILVVCFGGMVYGLISRSLVNGVDTVLEEEVREVAVEAGLAKSDEELQDHLQSRFFEHGDFDFQLSDHEGNLFFAGKRLVENPLPIPKSVIATPGRTTLRRNELGSIRCSALTARGPAGNLTIQACTSIAAVETQLRRLATTLVSAGLLVVIVAVAGGYFLARKALLPVEQMASAAERISATQLNQRVTVANQHDELGRLGSTINAMVDRLQRSIEETRRFTADAAHELRTPLAVMRTEADVALRGNRSTDEYRHVIEVMRKESQRLSNLADQLLQLCRHDAGVESLRREEVQLDAVLMDVAEQLRPMAAAKSVELKFGSVETSVVGGNDIQLSRVLFNVLENAIKHTPSGGSIKASIISDEDVVSVRIADSGPGIPESDVPHIFERFYRVDKSRSRNGHVGGAGLGLAISKAIVDAHEGTIRVAETNRSGTTFVIQLSRC
ncbi:MAG: HAMP domain-containing protein [Planctomycetales bacterium]|nr:HAMP domain-containing protein [Planctomycetales bacterium]